MNDHDGIADGSIGDANRVILQQKMVALEVEHRDLDQAIARFDSDPMPDELQMGAAEATPDKATSDTGSIAATTSIEVNTPRALRPRPPRFVRRGLPPVAPESSRNDRCMCPPLPFAGVRCAIGSIAGVGTPLNVAPRHQLKIASYRRPSSFIPTGARSVRSIASMVAPWWDAARLPRPHLSHRPCPGVR